MIGLLIHANSVALVSSLIMYMLKLNSNIQSSVQCLIELRSHNQTDIVYDFGIEIRIQFPMAHNTWHDILYQYNLFTCTVSYYNGEIIALEM